jgi:hypothetical protein
MKLSDQITLQRSSTPSKFAAGKSRTYTKRTKVPTNEVFSALLKKPLKSMQRNGGKNGRVNTRGAGVCGMRRRFVR